MLDWNRLTYLWQYARQQQSWGWWETQRERNLLPFSYDTIAFSAHLSQLQQSNLFKVTKTTKLIRLTINWLDKSYSIVATERSWFHLSSNLIHSYNNWKLNRFKVELLISLKTAWCNINQYLLSNSAMFLCNYWISKFEILHQSFVVPMSSLLLQYFLKFWYRNEKKLRKKLKLMKNQYR